MTEFQQKWCGKTGDVVEKTKKNGEICFVVDFGGPVSSVRRLGRSLLYTEDCVFRRDSLVQKKIDIIDESFFSVY